MLIGSFFIFKTKKVVQRHPMTCPLWELIGGLDDWKTHGFKTAKKWIYGGEIMD